MVSEIEYKLQQLTNFLGEKKLKQLGLLTCETCNHILAHSEDVLPDDSLLQKVYLTPDELADINHKIYEATGLKRPIINEELDSNKPLIKVHPERIKIPLSSWTQQELNAPLSLIPEVDAPISPTNSTNDTEHPNDHEAIVEAPTNESTLDETQDDNILDSNTVLTQNDTTISPISPPNTAYSPWDTKLAEQILAEIIADINNIPPPTSTAHGMGYLYNNQLQLPPHALICTECGRLYALAHPALRLMPLPVSLTPTEYEMLKGVYVDILL